MRDTPHLRMDSFQTPAPDKLFPTERATHPPRILLLYGSLRETSYSRLVCEEAARILERLGAEPRFRP